MRIGIDIDGVLTDVERFGLDYGIKYCYENNIPYTIKRDEYYEEDMLGITEEQATKFWNRYIEFYATGYPLRDFANEVIEILKEDNEIYIITARNNSGMPKELYGKMEELVIDWLKNNKVKYDKLIFTKESKLPYCIENRIDIMIEDSPSNIKEISTEIPVLCFDCSYNKNIEGNNITRIYSWYDILNKIKTIDKIK